MKRIDAARERARDDARVARCAEADGRERTVHVAIGDPQAPIATFLKILDDHGLLGDDGRLHPRVALTSMGDHFDWGTRGDRARAAEEGLQILAWLAAHPGDQVTILLGNHDLGRVGELTHFDDATFMKAQAEADAAYDSKDDEREKEFLQRFPHVPSSELVARDFSAFREHQRALVTELLTERRLRVAEAVGRDLLLCHAGVTCDDLDRVHVPQRGRNDAAAIAYALNAVLDAAVDQQASSARRSPLKIEGLHQPGTASFGEGRGIFYHRPGQPDAPEGRKNELRRRFDPRRLPLGLTEAIGHIRDDKCRMLLGAWAGEDSAVDGPLRHLVTDGGDVRYARGLPAGRDAGVATLLFLDGGMNHARPDAYQLLDLDSRAVFASVPPQP